MEKIKEDNLIKLYFENYYPDKKKYIYHEDWGVASVIFLFLLFLMIKTFSKKNVPVIADKIEKDPMIPERVIRNLENIKKIIIKDNPGKDLKIILSLINDIDNNLNLLSDDQNKEKIIEQITNQIIKFLELITDLYANQNEKKKDILFAELNSILSLFGLSEIFKKLIEDANNKRKIIKDNSNEIVKLSKDDLDQIVTPDEVVKLSPEDLNEIIIPDQEDEKESSIFNIKDDEDESLTLDDFVSDDEEEEQIVEEDPEALRIKNLLGDKNIEEIKRFIVDKKAFIDQSRYLDIKEAYEYIINNFNLYTSDEIKEVYVFLIDSNNILREFEELFGGSILYEKVADQIEYLKDLEATFTDYDKLLIYLKSKKIYIEEYKQNKLFIIKINSEEYRFGKLIPLKNNDISTKFYYLVFHEENNKFDIYINPNDVASYRLYDASFKFLFENTNLLELKKICEGDWTFNVQDKKFTFIITKPYPGFEKTNIEDVVINSKTYIGKDFRASIKEFKGNPSDGVLYYYCIKIDDSEIFVKEINGNFLNFIKEMQIKKYFRYKTYNNQIKMFRFDDNKDLIDLINIDCNTGKNHKFLQSISSGKEKLAFDDQIFKKVNSFLIKQEKGITVINTTRNWFQS